MACCGVLWHIDETEWFLARRDCVWCSERADKGQA